MTPSSLPEREPEMNVREAVDAILGKRLAKSITDDMGLHWAVVAAMTDPRSATNPEAVAIIRNHVRKDTQSDPLGE